jgi:hypothetical protein
MQVAQAVALALALGASRAVPAGAQDVVGSDPLPVALAYAAALEARDAAGVGAALDAGARFSGDVCCPSTAAYLAALPPWWASGVRSRVVVEQVAGDTATVRSLNSAADDHVLGLPPVEVVYELTVQDGRIVAVRGAADWGSGQRRDAVLAARAAAAAPVGVGAGVARATATPPQAAWTVSPQGRGTRSVGPWVLATAVALLGVLVLAACKRPPVT